MSSARTTGLGVKRFPLGCERYGDGSSALTRRPPAMAAFARLSVVAPHLHLNTRVLSVSREGFDKVKTVDREKAPFVIRALRDGEEVEFRARAVIGCRTPSAGHGDATEVPRWCPTPFRRLGPRSAVHRIAAARDEQLMDTTRLHACDELKGRGTALPLAVALRD